MRPLPVTFRGGVDGGWSVISMSTLAGEPLPKVDRVDVQEGTLDAGNGAAWVLRGVVGHLRYTSRDEAQVLRGKQAGLGRPEATHAAMIPIRKTAAWWDLAQDERRAVFEERSRHIAATLRFLPAVARRLHHCRDLEDPFDFITWFEFAPEYDALFDELAGLLRATEEWSYVEREVDIRLDKG